MTRNPIAKNAYKANVSKAFIPKKGKGSYKRNKVETKRLVANLNQDHHLDEPVNIKY